MYCMFLLTVLDDDLFIVTPEKKNSSNSASKTSKPKSQQKPQSPKHKPSSALGFFGTEPVASQEKTISRKKKVQRMC